MITRTLFLPAGFALLLAPLVLPAPAGLAAPAWFACGLALTMALWWLTEALPLAVTALLPLAVARSWASRRSPMWPVLSEIL